MPTPKSKKKPTNPQKRYIARWWKSVQDGQWYWSLTARNGEQVTSAEGYSRERSALKTVSTFDPVIYKKEKIEDPNFTAVTISGTAPGK